MSFQKATKKQARLRMAISGPAGAGKTYTALRLATLLGKKVAVIDTEHGSASKYADRFPFDVLELSNYHPDNYIKGIKDAESAGYDVLVIDSLTHAWNGQGGVLEVVEAAGARARGNSYAGWREGTPLQNKLVEAILSSKAHIIATMRTKTEYALEKDERTGKTQPKKIGLAPVQRDGMEYEFDIAAIVDVDHNLIIEKTRCEALDGKVFKKPGEDLATPIIQWLTDGAPAVERLVFDPAKAQQSLEKDAKALDAKLELRTALLTSPEKADTWVPFIKQHGLTNDAEVREWFSTAKQKTGAANAH